MKRYFLHDPQGETEFFETSEKFKEAMDKFDFLGNYCDDGWSEEVENVIAGIIPEGISRNDNEDSDDWEDGYDFFQRYATHQATRCHETPRPDDVGEDGYSVSTGEYWGDWDYRCNYRFEEIVKAEQ